MKRSKKFLSVILAVLMAFSSLTVGFYAIAAETSEGGEETTELTAVEKASKAINDFYNASYVYTDANGKEQKVRYYTIMFSAKEIEKDGKAEALKAFDEVCAQIKALTADEKAELKIAEYVYILGLEADVLGREAGKSSNNAKVYGTVDAFDKLTEKLGDLPADYKTAYDTMKAVYVKVDGTLFNSSFDFKAKDGETHYTQSIDAIKKLSPNAVAFAEYFASYDDAFYFSAYSPTSSGSNLTSLITDVVYNHNQDKLTITGKDASSPSYSKFIKHTYNPASNTWVAGQNAVTYKAAMDEYYALVQSEMIVPAKAAIYELADIFGAIYGADLKEVIIIAYEKGMQYYETGKITVPEINDVLAKVDALEGDRKDKYDKVIGGYKLKVAVKIDYKLGEDKYTADASADDVYNNQIRVSTNSASDLVQALRNVLTQLTFDEFNEIVANADLDNLDEETVKQAVSLYASLTTSYRNSVTIDTLDKFMKMVKPAADDYNFAEDVAKFRTIPVNRADIGNAKDALGQLMAKDIIWSENGVQTSVDQTYEIVKTVLKLAKVEVNGKPLDLTNGLNDLLKDNVYQASVINAIYDLYANLSHNETETGVGMAPTIGSVIQMLISKNGIRGELVQGDNKFAAAIAKIDALPSVTPEEKEQGINDLDKIAAIEFTDADFGFKNGDKDGFIDALLAALRPITYLLSGDNGILGVAGVKIRMFDSVDAEGVYGEDGIYAMLVPLLEQIGLTDLPTPIEYRTNYYTVRETMGKNLGYDEILRPVIESLFKNIVQPIADVPLDGVIDILPRIAYILNTNMVDDTVKAVINSTGNTLAGLAGNLDLSAKAVNNIIAGVTIQIDEETAITLKPINWHILSDCATVEAVESHSNANKYVMLRTGDTDSCFSTVFFYIHNLIFADAANYAAVRALLEANLSGIALSTVIRITDKLTVADRNAAFAQFLALTGYADGAAIPQTKADAQKRFTDIAGFEFYDDYVAYTSVYNSFITGTNPPQRTMFSPKAPITRAMFVTILYRMAGEPYKDANPHDKTPFTDITNTSVYYYDAACWALDNGISNQTTFRATDNVNRQETASFLFRYAKENELILNENYKNADLTGYSDYKDISEWAVEAMQWANYNGMITGTQQGTVNPMGDTQRIHATKILYGFGKNCDIGNFA